MGEGIIELSIEEKRCKQCNEQKVITEYAKNWKYIKNICKKCIREYSKINYSENKEKYSILHKDYYTSNKDKVLINQRFQYSINREEKLKKCKEYKKTSRWRLNSKIQSQKRRAITNWFKNDWTITLDAIQDKLIKQNFTCNYCWCDLKLIQKHLDHILPLSKWWYHSIDNVHWTCATCNLRKNNKTHDEFLNIIIWNKK